MRTKPKKLNGTIKVGLGRSPSGKVLGYDTHWYHFYSSETASDQLKKMSRVLRDASERKRKTFYSHGNRGYVEVSLKWLQLRYADLMELLDEEESSEI